jgi:hypothetical protein
MTMISVATPSMMPMKENPAITEIKPSRRSRTALVESPTSAVREGFLFLRTASFIFDSDRSSTLSKAGDVRCWPVTTDTALETNVGFRGTADVGLRTSGQAILN